MYYVIVVPVSEDAAYLETEPTDVEKTWLESCNTGELVDDKNVPPLAVTTSEDYGTVFKDAVASEDRQLIISQEFLDVLISAELKNLQSFPVKVIDHESDKTFDYYLCNVVGTIPCLDRKKARLSESHGFTAILKLAIDEGVVHEFNKQRKPADQLKLFRLDEDTTYLLASEEISMTIKQADLDGVEILKPEECGDFV